MPSQLLDPPVVQEDLEVQPIGVRSSGMLMTPDEFDAVLTHEWDSRYRHELIHGVLIVTPPPDFGERRPNEELAFLLLIYQSSHPNGSCLLNTVNEETISTPTGRRRVDRAVWIQGDDRSTPSIVVEFVSDSARDRKRDYEDKRTEFRQVGIKEYWVIDRFRRQMTVFCGDLEPTLVGEGSVYTSSLLPGFEVPLARLLSHAVWR